MKRIILVVLVAAIIAASAKAAARAETFYRTYKLSSHTVIVSCKDGAAPVVATHSGDLGRVVFVSCEGE